MSPGLAPRSWTPRRREPERRKRRPSCAEPALSSWLPVSRSSRLSLGRTDRHPGRREAVRPRIRCWLPPTLAGLFLGHDGNRTRRGEDIDHNGFTFIERLLKALHRRVALTCSTRWPPRPGTSVKWPSPRSAVSWPRTGRPRRRPCIPPPARGQAWWWSNGWLRSTRQSSRSPP